MKKLNNIEQIEGGSIGCLVAGFMIGFGVATGDLDLIGSGIQGALANC